MATAACATSCCPAIALGVAPMALLARTTRAAVLDVHERRFRPHRAQPRA
jgi:ABC-type dipeptide/oligopeptide/nickel transport system permease component